MTQVEIIITDGDGTVLLMFDLTDAGDFPAFLIADDVKEILEKKYQINEK